MCLVLIVLSVSYPAVADSSFDPQRVRWTTLDFSASKFLLTARASVSTRTLPASETAGQLATTPIGRPVTPGSEVTEIIYRASGFGMESVTTLWMDPSSGSTLQQIQEDQGNRQRQRTYRFTDVGAYHYTRRPADSRQKSLPASQWTDLSQGMRAYSPSTPSQPVTTATVLLWMASAAELSRSGDRLEALTFSRRHLNRVTLQVTGQRTVNVDFTEQDPVSGSSRRRASVDALVLKLSATPADAQPDDEEPFELLGLHGDLELLLDPRTRVPLQLRGQVKIIGQVTIRLRRAVLR
jgi:hypothetical protein